MTQCGMHLPFKKSDNRTYITMQIWFHKHFSKWIIPGHLLLNTSISTCSVCRLLVPTRVLRALYSARTFTMSSVRHLLWLHPDNISTFWGFELVHTSDPGRWLLHTVMRRNRGAIARASATLWMNPGVNYKLVMHIGHEPWYNRNGNLTMGKYLDILKVTNFWTHGLLKLTLQIMMLLP